MPSDGSNKVIKHIHTKTTEKNKNKEQTYATLENISVPFYGILLDMS